MQGLAPCSCRTMDSLRIRVTIPDFPVLSFKYVHILHAYAYVPEFPFHKSSLRTFTDRLLWVHALQIPTRQKVSESGKGVNSRHGLVSIGPRIVYIDIRSSVTMNYEL